MTAQSIRSMLGAQPSTATPTDSVLIIIDAQNEYATGQLATAHIGQTRAAIAALLQRYRAARGHVVHVVHQVPEGAPVFTPGTALAREFDELAPRAGEKLISKQHPSAFAQTDLQDHLKSLGLEKVVLVGYMAHVCVSTTARIGDELGYNVILAEEAIGDRDIPGAKADELVKMVFAEIGDAFGTVVKCDSIA